MAQQQKTSKVGRNKAKCERYRTRKGRSTGTKKPRKAGSNPQQRTFAQANTELSSRISRYTRVDVAMSLPMGGSRLLSVPREWVR